MKDNLNKDREPETTSPPKGSNLKADVNGFTICYDDLGTGETPVIFIHGFPFDKSSWQPQLEYFKDTQRVIAYDIRGYGQSTSGKEVSSIDLFATDLVKFMDTLKIQQAVVCGLSMGGYILLNAQPRFPDRFKAFVLCDTQCIPDSPEGKTKRQETITKIQAGGLKEFADGFIQKVFCQNTLQTKTPLVERITKVVLATSQHTLTAGLTALANRLETCTSLAGFSVPVLVVCGREDTITPLVQSEFLHNHITNSQLCIIDTAGHLSNLEQPEEFNKHLEEFLKSVNP